jgi:hypothetical protein
VTQPEPPDRITRALAELPQVDLEPLVARQQWVQAQKRFAGASKLRSNFEPALLVALATAQLVWAIWRVFELSSAHLGG